MSGRQLGPSLVEVMAGDVDGETSGAVGQGVPLACCDAGCWLGGRRWRSPSLSACVVVVAGCGFRSTRRRRRRDVGSGPPGAAPVGSVAAPRRTVRGRWRWRAVLPRVVRSLRPTARRRRRVVRRAAWPATCRPSAGEVGELAVGDHHGQAVGSGQAGRQLAGQVPFDDGEVAIGFAEAGGDGAGAVDDVRLTAAGDVDVQLGLRRRRGDRRGGAFAGRRLARRRR